jgi:large subunit ribosomal protein L25
MVALTGSAQGGPGALFLFRDPMGSAGERIHEQVRVMAAQDIQQLQAQRRTPLGKKVAKMRREGRIPGIVYGPVVEETVPVSVDGREFARFYQTNGHSTLFDLLWEDGKESVFIREVQVDAIRRVPIHVDFFAPNLRRPVRAMVPLVLHNVSNTSEAILTEARTEIEVEALPARIPSQIDVDCAGLTQPGDAIRVGDLQLPDDVTAVTDASEIVVQMESIYVAPEEVEEAEAPAEAAAPAAEASEPAAE